VLKVLHTFQFRIEQLKDDLAEKTVDLAYQYGITVYDASYVALSSIHGTWLITSDEELHSRIEGEKALLLNKLSTGDLKRL